ncbi:MAG: 2-iminoacetate synthase ThiH [Bacillota bacterium]
MSFYQVYQREADFEFATFFEQVESSDVEAVLAKDDLTRQDLLVLLSPAAQDYLEEMAQRAHQLTVQHFGRVIFLYAPLYLANYCINNCAYCGFSTKNQFQRQKLDLEQIEREAKALAAKGIKDVVILTGESRPHTPVDYLESAVEVLREYFSSLALEVYPLEVAEYRQLVEAGIDGLTIYQEVYNQAIYQQVHLKGPKRDYKYRLDAPERGCQAGMRRVNIGALLGLDNWRREAYFSALHANYLQDKYLDVEFSLSVPRLNPHLGGFEPNSIVEERHLVQIMLAYRLFLPTVGLNLSTREKPELRDNLLPLGVTKFSAESSTAVGGYAVSPEVKQFDNPDQRTVQEVKEHLRQQGYQPVVKNWHRI